MNVTAILSVTLILFSVIDIIGSLPVLINMKRDGLKISAGVATFSAASIMLVFLFFGATLLGLFGIEMILGIRIFRDHHDDGGEGSIVPIAFPLIAGAGTLTTIISLKAEFDNYSILAGIIINLVFVFIILNSLTWISNKISPQVSATLRKVFGIILMAIAIQMMKDNF